MKLESVNRSLPRSLSLLDREMVTVIAKEPVAGAVGVGPGGLDGDGVANTRDHGGLDQAVYLYGLDDYRWWAQTEGLDVHAGLFGENLTVSGLLSAELEVAGRFTIGAVELEVTGPRIPCATLSGRVGDRRFAARFAAARRPGAYVRVISGGVIAVGDQVDPMAAGSGVTLLECIDGYCDRAMPPDEVERLLAAPIASRFRTMLETRLDREGRR